LNWVNELLKANLAKIEQLGTGAVYCHLLEALYPGKVPMGKVNWKAKFDY
jgi:microtubule-associated protein, RP/EB family